MGRKKAAAKDTPSLLRFWREAAFETAPHIHPQDQTELLKGKRKRSLAEIHAGFDVYAASDGFGRSDGKLHCSLLPMPFVGDLERADIFLLLLNPGLSFQNYFAEYRVPEYRARLLANLRGENAQYDYPFLCLDPKFCWDGGFVWWEKKLRDVVGALVKRDEVTHREALRVLAKRLAAVELLPYHSSKAPSGSLLSLASARASRQFVTEELLPRARANEILIIVTRQAPAWGIQSEGNVVVYDQKQARGAHMSLESPGGKALWSWLESRPTQ